MQKTIRIFAVLSVVTVLAGCTATQPVVWNTNHPIDLEKGGKVSVNASCEVPAADLDYLGADIQKKIESVLSGCGEDNEPYQIKVTITKYDKGNAFARFMLIGLGQMHLHGTVEITQNNPPIVVREGQLKKDYCVGGMVGGSASMQSDVLPKVGQAIAEAIQAKEKI